MTKLVQLSSSVTMPVAAPSTGGVLDTFGRVHDNLRISVTDRCNIRCFYCMPEDASDFIPAPRQLTFEQIVQFAKVAQSLGVRQIRLTGGEPLLRRNLPDLVSSLANLGWDDLALTTNAVLLAKFARPLYNAGLRRLNIHVDSLDRERFCQITRRDDLPRVLEGIEKAIETGFSIKLNAVAVKGLSEPDIIPLARYARERKLEVRYIEFMPLDSQELWSRDRVLLAADIIETLSAEFGPLQAVPDADPRAPASEYRYVDGQGRVGVIASVSRPFCLNCNRLRLTADGKLRYCLFAHDETDVVPFLDPGKESELESVIRSTVWRKWRGHEINRPFFSAPQRPMYSIGG